MLPELPERDATGEIAVIYEEIKRFSAVPYVSSMQRHLATRPGWLEWVWACLRPAFVSGRAQEAAWRVAERLEVPPLAPISRDALCVWGVDDAAEVAIRGVCDNFIRVSPVNLVLSGLLRRLLCGERPRAAGEDVGRWDPPAPLPALPAMGEIASLPSPTRAVLLSFGAAVGGHPFVPGLYRLLARWPAFLAHLAVVLRPHFDDPETRAACRRLEDGIEAEVPGVFHTLPPLPARPAMPPSAQFAEVLTALAGYRKTSPEMVTFSLMIRNALPSGMREGPAAPHSP